jgi:sigma-B regulation protein RsbU (phosphoserine phosphatase)
MVLGIFPDIQYDQSELPLRPGDRLLFYTDGITEARDPEGEEYGEDRLAAAALAVTAPEALAIKDAVLADVNAFTHGKFEDDATLIVVGIS